LGTLRRAVAVYMVLTLGGPVLRGGRTAAYQPGYHVSKLD